MKHSVLKGLFGAVLLVFAAAQAAVLDVADLVEKNGPAVVNISTTKIVQTPQGGFPVPDDDEMYDFFRRFFPPGAFPRGGPMREIPTHGAGSGFIVSSDGYILTNAHVVQGVDEVTVKLTDKRKFTARVIGYDTRTDIAVIKINASDLPTVKIGDPDKLRVGEAVVAIGSPFGFENSVTAGIVSAKGRSLPSENYVPFIQTDVAVNPGNSGGPLFNLRGEVVGVNSQIYTRSGGYQGLSFAIPIDLAMDVAGQIKSGGKVARGWLGVAIQEVSADLAESFGLDRPRGALIAEVQDGSPADKGGLQVSDVVLKFNGKAIENAGDLPRAVGSTRPGSKVSVQVWRKRALKELTVVTGEMPGEDKVASAEQKSYARGGLMLSELTAEQRKELKLNGGLLVVEASGDAVRAGIREGDVILAVNNTEVRTVEQFRKLIGAVAVGKSAAILVRRGESSLYIPLKISGNGND
ncbi:MAG: DegQ family serine endoprotease [Pseudomonadota bacterium]